MLFIISADRLLLSLWQCAGSLLSHSRNSVTKIVAASMGMTLAASVAHGQESVAPAHLVGHEESALLLRVQDVIDNWDPRKLENPYVETSSVKQPDGSRRVSKQLRRADLSAFIADVEAAEALGKAFFWEMQAGSDFRRTSDGSFVGTACASCHYRFGADARDRNTVRIPYVAWDKYIRDSDHPLEYGEQPQAFDIEKLATQTLDPLKYQHGGPFSLIVGSQGVAPRVFQGFPAQTEIDVAGEWQSERSEARPAYEKTGWSDPEWAMFYKDHVHTSNFHSRQITNRNSPTVINSAFADRLFHDGRAESTFNGFSIFGDADPREVIYRRHDFEEVQPDGGVLRKSDVIHVRVAITKAALASQAVGPIVNEIEMSYLGRTFPNLARKLLDRQALRYQTVDADDSLFGPFDRRLSLEHPGESRRLTGAPGRDSYTYRSLIKRAFKPEWWNWDELNVPLRLLQSSKEDGEPTGHLMEANFSLYWGLSVMLYQTSLVSNQSPFDDMLRGDGRAVESKWQRVKSQIGEVYLDRAIHEKPLGPDGRSQTVHTETLHASGKSVFQHGFRIFLDRGCVECHSGPLMSELYERFPEDETLPIAHRLDRVLLPNSRSDAIAVVKQQLHDSMIEAISQDVIRLAPSMKPRAKTIALELDLLREPAQKNEQVLLDLVSKHLTPLETAANGAELPTIVKAICDRLLAFERRTSGPLGNRRFFTEAERIALVELLADPVLVEKMAVPPKQQKYRPVLPINGIQEKGYAFYDLGFYNLGVSPPRYDRGIGDIAVDLRRTNPSPASTATDASAPATTTLESVQVEKLPSRRPPSSAPGSAYQFRLEWYRDASEKLKQASRSDSVLESLNPSSADRTVSEGPKSDLDAEHWSNDPAPDTSWDRIDLDPSMRRAGLRFRSRARQLVTDESAWGFRKPLVHDNEIAFWGSFKTPTLRNVELTAPYMHNGRLMTLADVIEFYDRDGDELEEEAEDDPERLSFVARDLNYNPDVHPALVGLKLTLSDRRALEFFLRCLTDERVLNERAPFDHPSLTIVNGYKPIPEPNQDQQFEENIISISATQP